jgi:oxygen-dependent protoporphyrinogen oxidase
MPLGPGSFISTKLFSPAAKFRVMKEPFIGRASKEESIAEFVERRLGRDFLDYAIDPFVAGVFAGKPSSWCNSAFPKLYALEENTADLSRAIEVQKTRPKTDRKNHLCGVICHILLHLERRLSQY